MEEKLIRDALVLWATIDPIGTLAIFASVATSLTPALRRKTALKATLYSAAILLGAIVVGQILLSARGIELLSLQVAGGAILFLFALQMISGSGMQEQGGDTDSGHDLAVFPLAVPSIASPGAIRAVILLTDNNLYSIPDAGRHCRRVAWRTHHHLSADADFKADTAGHRYQRCGHAGSRHGTDPGRIIGTTGIRST